MLRLLLPALIPSWRFFDTIGPSPRIEFAVLKIAEDPAPVWREFRPRPARLSWATVLLRLFWNPGWNESLYLVTCAEKFYDGPSTFSEQEILGRVAREIQFDPSLSGNTQPVFLRVRVKVLKRERGSMTRQVLFISAPRRLDEQRRGAYT